MANKENIEWPEVFDVPDYSLLVANELVPAIGMQPPDGKWLCFNEFDIDEIFKDIKNDIDITLDTDTGNTKYIDK
jgi:hypothetical protein